MPPRAGLYYILHGWIKGTKCMCMQLTVRVISILECVINNEDTVMRFNQPLHLIGPHSSMHIA